LSFHCHMRAQRLEINKKWLLLPQKHKVSKNLLSIVINQHTGTPLAMALLFHGENALLKSLAMLIAHCPEVLGRSPSDNLRNAPLKTYYAP